ncbi:MAG: hypothetical protein JSR67_11725 [Proteobacteria bacterium]|nr:hypothetical protein [Pseudomonadota bacterium]
MLPERRTSRGGGLLAVGLVTLLGSACSSMGTAPRPVPLAPIPSPASANASLVAEYLQMLQRLAQAPAAQQAEIAAGAQRDYDSAPTPSHTLRLALILATPGHAAANATRAQGMLRELMASPEVLSAPERALAFLTLSQIDAHLTLEAENRRLQAEMARADREHLASARQRLQAELDENTRLRRELDAAHAKLDAISSIERSLNERKTTTGHSP